MKQNKIKRTIIILSILFGLVLLVFCGVILYQNLQNRSTKEILEENFINREKESNPESSPTVLQPIFFFSGHEVYAETISTAGDTTLALYQGHPGVNVPFKIGNMFPGDVETRPYDLSVTYKNEVRIHFAAKVRPGYEKLAEVMMLRVELPAHGGVLYDGLMRDMTDEIITPLTGDSSSKTEIIPYVISAYVDTSVGNDYQDTTLIADLKWWAEAEDEGNLAPATGIDEIIKMLWPVLLVMIALIVIIVLRRQRKEDRK